MYVILQAHALSNFSFNATILSSISHFSSSVRVFFLRPSFNFFSRSLICFLASFALTDAFALTSILFPAHRRHPPWGRVLCPLLLQPLLLELPQCEAFPCS